MHVSLSASNVRSLDNCINTAIYKVFNVGSSDCIQDVRHFLDLQELDTMIQERSLSVDSFVTVVLELCS